MALSPPRRSQSTLKLRVSPAAEKQARQGHPWVFETSIRDQNRTGQTGELAVIYDRNDRFLAVGLFDAESPIRVRLIHTGSPQAVNPEWWRANLERSLQKRAGLFDRKTTGYRMINGESDHWPGLVLDRYGSCLVVKLYTASWLPRIEEITSIIRDRCSPQQIVLRLSRNIQERAASTGFHDGQLLHGSLPEATVTFLESGLKFEAEVVRGQKTGFFLDQRENRRRVETLAAGRDVLNAFSFSGAFSAYAARGGAQSVTDLDISAHALNSSRRNHALNSSDTRVAACRREWIQADVFDWLDEQQTSRYDLIILDPPSMARREAERSGAERAYARLANLGAQRLNPGGVLVCCSCSAHVSAEQFFAAALRGAKSAGSFRELERTGHAPDHKATFPEGEYLKAIYLRLDKEDSAPSAQVSDQSPVRNRCRRPE